MPYQLVGATRFYQRREVKDLLAYLRLAHNPNDRVAFNRVLNVPPRGIGKNSVDNLTRWANKLDRSPYAILKMLQERTEDEQEKAKEETEDQSRKTKEIASRSSNLASRVLPADAFDARSRKVLLAFVELLDEMIAARSEMKLGELCERMLLKVAYEPYIHDGSTEGEDRWGNVVELQRVTSKYSAAAADVTLPQFLEEVALVADIDTLRDDMDAPTLMTLHTAKGLEFRAVFIVGLEEGLFPHSRSLEDPAQMEEERRLCYVGITRAKERLYLIHAFRRALYGNSEAGEPSRYLADVPLGLIGGDRSPITNRPKTSRAPLDDDDDVTESRRRPAAIAARSTRLPTSSRDIELPIRPKVSRKNPAPTPRSTEFNPADKVLHATFGEGVVVSSKIVGADEEVEVAFFDKGVKRLIARYAGLRKK
jgi:DNA helicase II / ATP-dependent DNA helicase PcrA